MIRLLAACSLLVVLGWLDPSEALGEQPIGKRLVYRVQWPSGSATKKQQDQFVQALQKRLQSVHLASRVRLSGMRLLEVDLFSIDQESLALAQAIIPVNGKLEMRIVADRERHATLFRASQDVANEKDRVVLHPGSSNGQREPLGYWATVGRYKDEPGGLRSGFGRSHAVRDAETRKQIDMSTQPVGGLSADEFGKWLRETGHRDVEVLVLLDDDIHLGNQDIKMARSSPDSDGRPSVAFTMTKDGARKLRALTHRYRPKGTSMYRLSILVDGNLITAPTLRSVISERGQITGVFSRQETRELAAVLGSPRLRATIDARPVRVETITREDR